MYYNSLYNLLGIVLLLCASCSSEEPREAVRKGATSVETMALTELNRQLTEKDEDIIECLMRRKNWTMNYHSEGFYSMVLNEGRGKNIADNSMVELLCKVQLLDGTVCYERQLRSFKVNTTNEIAGLHQGMLNRRGGDKLRFIFPPYMAYGLLGDRDKIPPRAALIFEVEVLNVD
ncbi:MAG: FKBP-type peptidyl-prolyl cis-trans isomerase [Bacteroidales bacterium]|nr:FKBP-type peptidyl-prolyl cis-trans isomerase [Bacteroidales bacterium]MCL2133662.1 FKBP-type peptidyl-prolyl cis-trans isomerase [Bacteroidales bacterium]